MLKRCLISTSIFALSLSTHLCFAAELVSGDELTNVTVSGGDFEFSFGTSTIGINNLYDFWDANPDSVVRVISPGGLTVSTGIDLGVNGGRELHLQGPGTSFYLNTNITGSTTSGEGGVLNIGPDFFDSSGDLVAVYIDNGAQLQELDSINVNAQFLQIKSGSSVTLGEGDSLTLARRWFDLDGGGLVELSDNTVFQNLGYVEQLGANSLVDIRGIFYNENQYVLQGGTLKIEKDAYIENSATFDQFAGTSNIIQGGLSISGSYNMYGGQLTADAISSNTISRGFVSDGVDSEGNQKWILTGVDIGAANGSFNYVDGGVAVTKNDMYIRTGGLLGQDIVMDEGEFFRAKNMYLGTLDDGLTSFGGQGVGALARGSIVLDGGSNYVIEDMVIGEQATMIQHSGSNRIGGNLYLDGGDYTQNNGSNTVSGSLWLGDGGQYTMNGGQLTVGSIPGSGTSTGYCQEGSLDNGTRTNNCDQLGTPMTTVNGSLNYVNGGVRLTNDNLSVSQNGLLGTTVLIDEAGETFGALNTSIANEGSIVQSTGANIIAQRLTVAATGQYDLSGGRLEFGSFAGAGKINFTGGDVFINGDSKIGLGGPFGENLIIDSGKNVSLAPYIFRSGSSRYDLTIDADATLTLDGGVLVADQLINNGTFDYVSGRLDLNSLTFGNSGPLGSFTVTNNHNLYVRNDVTIEAGATVTINNGYISGGATITNNGVLVLDGGTLSTSQINNVGAGLFDFTKGSLAVNTLDVGSSGLLGSTVVLDSSKSINAGTVTVNSGSRLEVNGGTSSATNLTNEGVVVIAQAGQLIGGTYTQSSSSAVTTVDGILNANVEVTDGELNGSGTINGNAVNGGNIGPGQSPGSLLIMGDYTQTEFGILNIEIGGLLSGDEFDVLNIDGIANLSGTLDVDLYDLGSGLFTPSLGDTFDFLTAETIVGDFDLLTLAVLGNGLGWQLDYLYDEFDTLDVARLSVVTASAVPVPAAAWLFGSGLIGLISIARRKKA